MAHVFQNQKQRFHHGACANYIDDIFVKANRFP